MFPNDALDIARHTEYMESKIVVTGNRSKRIQNPVKHLRWSVLRK